MPLCNSDSENQYLADTEYSCFVHPYRDRRYPYWQRYQCPPPVSPHPNHLMDRHQYRQRATHLLSPQPRSQNGAPRSRTFGPPPHQSQSKDSMRVACNRRFARFHLDPKSSASPLLKDTSHGLVCRYLYAHHLCRKTQVKLDNHSCVLVGCPRQDYSCF